MILKQAEQWPFRVAAVTQDLVNGLHDEFHQWWNETYPERRKNKDPALMDYQKYGDPDVGPISNWPSIESFMKDKYPAAHQGLSAGYEGARVLLDWDKMYPNEEPGGHQRYETGPEAVATHGYDPKEIAAGMLLLHNRSQPLREDLAQEDEDRLADISQKRHKMQQDYEQRQLVGVQQMPPSISLTHIPHPNGGGGSIVRAYDGDQKVGELAHAKSGKIVWVDVHPDYQRQGIASAMLDHARAHQPGVYHAPNLERSDDSRAWSEAVP